MKRETDLTSIYVQTRSATGRRRTRSDGGPVVELDRQDRPWLRCPRNTCYASIWSRRVKRTDVHWRAVLGLCRWCIGASGHVSRETAENRRLSGRWRGLCGSTACGGYRRRCGQQLLSWML